MFFDVIRFSLLATKHSKIDGFYNGTRGFPQKGLEEGDAYIITFRKVKSFPREIEEILDPKFHQYLSAL